jgi:hypothetical protein
MHRPLRAVSVGTGNTESSGGLEEETNAAAMGARPARSQIGMRL